jgi:hypothetical protein
MAESILEKYTRTRDGMRKFQQERAIYEFTRLINSVMDTTGVSRSDLAMRLNKSKSWVTQFLDTGANKTVRTIADVLAALDYELHGTAQPISKDMHDDRSLATGDDAPIVLKFQSRWKPSDVDWSPRTNAAV